MLPVLFGLGAISAAKYPDGVLAENSRRLRRLVLHLRPAPPAVRGERRAGPVDRPRPGRHRHRAVAERGLVTDGSGRPACPPTARRMRRAPALAAGVTVRFGGLLALSDV